MPEPLNPGVRSSPREAVPVWRLLSCPSPFFGTKSALLAKSGCSAEEATMRQSARASCNGAWSLGASGLGSRIRGGCIRLGGAAFVLLIAACFSLADDVSSDEEPNPAEQITAGHELFLREWKVDDRRSVSGDGLGPMYNAASCAKCHRLGGIGGAGANDHNVDLLTVKVKAPGNVAVADGNLRQQVAAFHPALAIGQLSATTVLHRFSPDPNYDAWRGRFLSASRQAQLPLTRIVAFTTGANKHPVQGMNPVQRLDGMAYQHSQRNTPALFGAGMIDSLPDSVFVELEQRQAAKTGGGRSSARRFPASGRIQQQPAVKTEGVSGRVPRAANGHAGRFGWRGQTENLHEFVLGACAVELGLEAPGRAQPIDPLQVRSDRPVLLSRHGLDISDEQCKSLTQFVAHLSPPQQLIPSDSLEAQIVASGERRFEKIGCADCHVRQVAHITGIYSDLLLHDMGEALEDPVPAS
ncbi:MAG TPA: di-heme oxidoredictase family protein, partial [Pirellulales bacterium]|nr:di-heme oxidoredictase family protein [Pirellulales bacterium]